ncbi:hypothetical protein ACIQXD_30430 [Streptomyces uncialis]|uniref:hypothetical protein n=1 Tax=Streptomyces uncialis TaxID=1048205 RepID=UPI003813C003
MRGRDEGQFTGQTDIAYATNDVALQAALVAERVGIALTSHASPVPATDPRFVVVPLEPAIRLRKVFVWRLGPRAAPSRRVAVSGAP